MIRVLKLMDWCLHIVLGVALLGGCRKVEPARWVSIQGNSLEFPVPQNMRAEYSFGSPWFRRQGNADSSLSIGERSTNWSPYADTLLNEVRQIVSKAPQCAAPEVRQGRLSNGWECAWTEMRCPEGVSHQLAVFAVEGKRYVISGRGFSIAEMLALAGSGRVVSPERRSQLAQDKQTDPMSDIDRISGGPQIRRALLLGVLAGIGLMFACVFLWRGSVVLRILAVILCLIYAIFFGPFWGGLALMAFLGPPLFGFPGPAVVGAALGLMLLVLGAAVLLVRRYRKY